MTLKAIFSRDEGFLKVTGVTVFASIRRKFGRLLNDNENERTCVKVCYRRQ